MHGRGAVEKAIQFRPDIAVLDLTLPELNGLEAARRIRKALPSTGTIVLVLENSEELTREASDAGAHSLILKSDAKRLLVATIESVARQRGFLSAATPELGRQRRAKPESPWAKARRPRRRLTARE